MANLYGVANPVIAPLGTGTIGGANIALPANVETIIATSPALIAISNGIYYPAIFGQMCCQPNAAGLNAFTISARTGGGADWATQSYPINTLGAGQYLILPFIWFGPQSTVAWQGAGSVLNITATAGGVAGQALGVGTYFFCTLFRAPDQ
jgi:hypothetical protein